MRAFPAICIAPESRPSDILATATKAVLLLKTPMRTFEHRSRSSETRLPWRSQHNVLLHIRGDYFHRRSHSYMLGIADRVFIRSAYRREKLWRCDISSFCFPLRFYPWPVVRKRTVLEGIMTQRCPNCSNPTHRAITLHSAIIDGCAVAFQAPMITR